MRSAESMSGDVEVATNHLLLHYLAKHKWAV